MAKIKISCKHCHKLFIVDWDVIVKQRTEFGYRKDKKQSQINDEYSEESSLDLTCPICNKRASYKRLEGENVL